MKTRERIQPERSTIAQRLIDKDNESGCCSCWGFFSKEKNLKLNARNREITRIYRAEHKDLLEKQKQRKAERAAEKVFEKPGYQRLI